jgi:HSP20 family protein
MAADEVRRPHVLFLHAVTQTPRREAWQPQADVYRVPGGWLVKLELAGVRPEDLRLVPQASALLVQGMRRDECGCEGANCRQLEISYSRFERTLDLPGLPEAVELTVSYSDGMVTVRIVTEGGS